MESLGLLVSPTCSVARVSESLWGHRKGWEVPFGHKMCPCALTVTGGVPGLKKSLTVGTSISATLSAVTGGGSKRDQLDYFSSGGGSDDESEMQEVVSCGPSYSIEEDARRMLEWPVVCAQVAQFAATSVGVSVASSGSLTIGKTRKESEELLQQTAAAVSLTNQLDFSGIEDLQDVFADVMNGNVCRAQDLCRVRRSLSAAHRLYNTLQEQTGLSVAPLQAILAGCNPCTELEKDIEFCIDCSFATVLDQASSSLASARRRRQDNMKSLESRLKDTANKIVDAGGMDTALVTKRRARLCVAVRASHKSLLPGGIVLDVSNTGTTLFVEPDFAVHLNNAEMQLAAAEEAEVTAVLRRLSIKLIDKAEDISSLLERIVVLDLACARAAHARWLQAVEPVFSDPCRTEGQMKRGQSRRETENFMVQILGVRHPLLLAAALPKPVSTRNVRFRRTSEASAAAHSDTLKGNLESNLPVPIDILVKSQVKVVTITGPNTGGKTAALKTLGVVALMAKAGLFLPAVGQPTLPWFKDVLVDIGDDQSLQRSLSTFSGHIQRVCKILEAGSGEALVLLDEVGGGTDPSEGAALATAVLRHLASSVCLTLATTHSAELRTLKNQDSRFENASVEFDIKTLSPTYRVLWGIAGQSNALNIAASLKFDAAVIERARHLVKKLSPSKLGVRASEVMVPLVKQLDEQRQLVKGAADALANARDLHSQLLSQLDEAVKQETALKQTRLTVLNEKIANGKQRMDNVVLRYQMSLQGDGSDNTLSMRDAQNAIAQIAAELTADFDPEPPRGAVGTIRVSDVQAPAVGSKVYVRRLGKVPATVVEVLPGSNYISVQLGSMKLSVRTDEVSHRMGTSVTPVPQTPVQNKPVRRPDLRPKEEQPGSKDGSPTFGVAVQTSKNTLDLRGMRVDDAERQLSLALASRPPLSTLFVIHGIGTGAVKEAVLKVLRKHPYVAKYEDESTLNAGCTIVFIK